MEGLLLFALVLILLFAGYYVAFTFAGASFIVGLLILGPHLFGLMPYRILAVMENTLMMAIPMFILMGIVLQRSGLAEKLLESIGNLFGHLPGGLAVGTVLVGALLAATTGLVGASVVAMGIISLPVMLKHKYSPALATGTICASGTLGQIVPPSIVLILLADVVGVPVGDLFRAALIPAAILIALYIIYILAIAYIKPELCPKVISNQPKKQLLITAAKNVLPTLILIFIVLSSIFAGIATPTESAAMGAVGAMLLALINKKFSFDILNSAALETVKISSMVFIILIGASVFAMVFSYSGADLVVENFVMQLPGKAMSFIIFAMLAVLLLGFFLDFVEIVYILVPILTPIAFALNIDMVWFAVLIALNLQTSFLTPPFGFSLFFLRGVAPKSIATKDIYVGVIPFILIQLLVLCIIILNPNLIN